MKTLIISTLVLGLLAGTIFLWFTKSAEESEVPSDANEYVISFDEIGERVFIRARTWGLAGNHQEIILANEPINNKHGEYFKDRQFIFLDSTELYYKKKGADTLLIYVDYKSDTPENLTTNIKIEQIELEGPEQIKEYKMNYERYGLSKVSVYKVP
ncbi:MAG: hypothetical protein AB7L70_18860 [Pyrinomonadaceae bacterium]